MLNVCIFMGAAGRRPGTAKNRDRDGLPWEV